MNRIGAAVLVIGEKQRILYFQNPGRSPGPLEESAESQELPAFVVHHRAFGHTLEQVAVLLDRRVKCVQAGTAPLAEQAAFPEPQIEAVERLPHLAGNAIPHPTGTLAGGPYAAKN